jgi:hypothetical protein
MNHTPTVPCRSPRRTLRSSLRLTFGLTVSLATLPVTLQAGPTTPMRHLPKVEALPAAVQVRDETISLLAGLIGIERDLLLGQLFLQDGMVSAEGSHFTHPRHDNFPAIKDGLAQAGAPDLEPLLIALEQASDKNAVNEAYKGVLSGLQQAKSALQPTEQDVMGAVVRTVEAAAAMLDPSGTTEVIAYQEAWGLLMVARSQLDVLASSSDPAIKKAASDMAMAFDDVILFAPDPNASAPVPFDPALVAQLLGKLTGQAASI